MSKMKDTIGEERICAVEINEKRQREFAAQKEKSRLSGNVNENYDERHDVYRIER